MLGVASNYCVPGRTRDSEGPGAHSLGFPDTAVCHCSGKLLPHRRCKRRERVERPIQIAQAEDASDELLLRYYHEGREYPLHHAWLPYQASTASVLEHRHVTAPRDQMRTLL